MQNVHRSSRTNKTDLIYTEDENPVEKLKAEFEPKGIKVFPISGVSGDGIKELLYYVSEEIGKLDSKTIVFEQEFFPEEELLYIDLPYIVEKEEDMYVVEYLKSRKCLDTQIWIRRKVSHSSRNF